MLTQYAMIVLFAFGDGTVVPMETANRFSSPVACMMQAQQENLTAKERTYVCLPKKQADLLTRNNSAQVSRK